MHIFIHVYKPLSKAPPAKTSLPIGHECMYAYLLTRIFIYVHTRIHTSGSISSEDQSTHTSCLYVCIYTKTHTYIHTRIHTFDGSTSSEDLSTHSSCFCMYLYVLTHIFTYVHTRIHTSTRALPAKTYLPTVHACMYAYVLTHMFACIHTRILTSDKRTSSEDLCKGWCRVIGCLIFIGHFLQKSPIVCGFFAIHDLQLKASCDSTPPCTHSSCLYVCRCINTRIYICSYTYTHL